MPFEASGLVLDVLADVSRLEARVKDLETANRRLIDVVEWMAVRWIKSSDLKDAKFNVFQPIDLMRDLLS